MDGMNLFPLYLSLKVSTVATCLALLIGIPVAWILARKNFYGKSLVDSLVTLPIVMPPTVLGYYLLVVIGRNSWPGRMFEQITGFSLVFTWQAAVLAASLVSVPLLIKACKAAFLSVDGDVEDAARTLGKGELEIFWRVTLPLAWPGVLAGIVLSFARALGDFGTTLIVAGNIPNKTQTMPIAIYDALMAGDTTTVNFLVILMTVVALVILLALNKLDRLGRGNN